MRRATLAFLALSMLLTMAVLAQNVTSVQDYKQARVLASGEHWAEALVILERALKDDPDYPDALYLAGMCHLALKQYDKAEPRLKRVTEVRPEFFVAWGYLAQMYVLQKQFDKARQTLGALGKVKGGAPESHYGFGVLAWAEGNLEVAEKEWREAIRLRPGTPKAHHNLGVLLREKGDRVRALVALRDAVRLDPENALYRFNLGLEQMETGNRVDGMANLDRVRAQGERPDLANLALAVQMLLNGHPEPAEKAASRAYLGNPDLTVALVIRARALEALKRPQEARVLYEQALAGDSTLGEARRALQRIPAAAPEPAPSPASEAPAATPAASPAPEAPEVAPADGAPGPQGPPAPEASPRPEAPPADASPCPPAPAPSP